MLKFLNMLLGSREKSASPREEDALRRKYDSFKSLLIKNNRSLELLTELEHLLYENKPFTLDQVTTLSEDLISMVYDIAEDLNALSRGGYPGLFDATERIGVTVLRDLAHRKKLKKSELVLPLRSLSASLANEVGGKAANLGEVANRAGLPTPQGFAVSAWACQHFLRATGLAERIETRMRGLEVKDTDLSRKMRGKMVIELGELRGLKSREAESIKAWITSTHERWTPKYMEYETVFARRFVLIGTTNDDEFLGDPTGERRWLPSRVERPCDVEALVRDRLQLWAEARERWRADGVLWREAEDLAKEEHRNFKSVDPLEDIVRAWLVEEDLAGSKPADKGMLRTPEILAGALQLDPKSVGKREEMRLTSVLKALGYARDQKWVDGSPKKVWVPAHTLSYPPKSGMQK